MSRKRVGPSQFLQGFQGYLQADALSGYDGVYAGGDVVEVRKSWLFTGSENGGKTMAIPFSVVSSCRRHGRDLTPRPNQIDNPVRLLSD